jgi:minor extracellular serine protease Vpr
VLLLSAAVAYGQFQQTDGPGIPSPLSQSEYVIVTLQDPPTASYTGGVPGFEATKPPRGKKLKVADPAVQNYLRRLSDGHASFRSFLNNSAPKARVVRKFSLVQNALVVKLNGSSASALASGPGVKSVEFSQLYWPTMDVSVDLIRATSLWPAAGGRANAGAGIKVGVIDSGINDKHPFFACKGPIAHKVYTSGLAGNPKNLLVNTHGTHVAGTVGGCITVVGPPINPANSPMSGIAPAAELHDYNVFPGFGAGVVNHFGGAFSHDIADALENTVADGMDVVNMSLGGGVQGPHDFLADAVNATFDAGLVVAVAAGNTGPAAFTIESPGSAANALTAGAITNKHFLGIPVTVGSNSFGAVLGNFGKFEPSITANYTTTTPANGCTAVSTALTGKIAVINRGVCTFSTKIRNAQTAGAVGVLIVNNIIGDPAGMAQDGTPNQPTLPAAMLGQSDGAALGASGAATVDSGTVLEFVTNNQDIIASFSSRGPTPFTYLIKPDVTSPGVNVYSSVFGADPNKDFGFEMFQGTSMATPHLAGSAALLLQLHPGWAPADVKSALVNTADRPVKNATATGQPPAGTLDRGGGRINLEKATATPLTLSPVSASLGFFGGNAVVSATLDLTVFNVSGSSQFCTISRTGPSILSVPSGVSVGAGVSTNVTLTLNGGNSNQTPTGTYSGDVVFDCGGTILQVPWLAVVNRQAKP